MKEQRISFQTAKLVKDKGFMWKHVTFRKMTPGELADPENERVVRMGVKDAPIWEGDVETERDGAPCYNEEGKEIWPNKYNPKNRHYPRPTQGLMKEWLIQRHKLYATATATVADGKITWKGRVIFLYATEDGRLYITPAQSRDIHHEAMEDAIQEALKLIKNA